MADEDIPVVSLTEYMFSWFDKYADDIAMVELDTERSVTYKELKCLIIKASNGLQSIGVKEGDVVCMCSPNNIDYAVVFFAVTSLGAILQATNPLYTKDELVAQFEKCKTKYIVTVPSLVDKIKESINNNIKDIIVIGGGDKYENCKSLEKVISLDEGMDLKKATFNPKKTVACYVFSSGTTGLPKALQLSHYNIIANLVQLRAMSTVDTKESILVFLPFFHIYGLVAITASALTYGAKLVVMSRFSPLPFMEAIQKHQITFIHVVPPVMVLLTKLPETKNYDLTCVRVVACGAAPLSRTIEEQVKDIFKVNYISQGYGMSECIVTHADTEENHKFGSVGQAIKGIKTKIIDTKTGEPLGANQDGEVCIQGPQIMLGYLDQPDATAAIIDSDGWLKTGDVGHIDEDGYLFIVDRIKELIKYKGFQVAPAELEALLLKHPDIADAGVIGVPDIESGEIPKACVVLKKDAQLTAEEIQDFINKQVAPHKKLRGGVEFLDQIPKSASGKILRRMLRDSQVRP
ncbi:uncharacterized protein LOC126815811 isoform X1 [Patella vulgata]|uniref:uncharacterized protein LOC126815811 isoform X1 n=1 Tax=Patella vulgata TaxID=6465 RepID=UPI00218092D8|nr:uncharacterized protein LOC126815811 isoform X1 [Patella vulgata]XP_050397736.1 uncharacterized protein LOC126815811 isoform X1 [Patella vulgata]XP_050397763.1 uncharacterized protein LOC126815811 isoform X1 [Patella vulgata]XP_050397772.1 uncharacterized protein LOC126815811 isoform X1 [Patella vulgata]